MRSTRSACRRIPAALLLPVLLMWLAGFVFIRVGGAQDVPPVAPEPLEREMEEGAEEADVAVAREQLERDIDHGEEKAVEDEGGEVEKKNAADVIDVIEVILGAFDGPAPAENVAGIPANIRPFMPAFNQALTIEIHYLRKICNPDEQQLRQIRAAGEKKIKELAAIVARNQHGAFNNEEQGGRGPLQDALLASAKKVLPTDKYEAYRNELEERRAARLRGACEMMTLNVDHTLSLPLDDYDEVVKLLTENPRKQWTHTMQTFMYREYCPLPGVDLIEPVLNDRQKQIWSGKARRTSGIIFGWPANLGLQQWGLNVQFEELDDYSREVGDE